MPEYRTDDVIDENYRVISVLGGGTFGTVLRVERLLDGCEYAMKLFRVARARDSVERELKTLQAVNHPNINRVIWADRLADGQWYLLTELIDGSTLEHILDRGDRIPLSQALHLEEQLIDALRVLHPNAARIDELKSRTSLNGEEFDELQSLQHHGWVHRDISSKNLMVTCSGDLMVIDFGLASRVGTAVRTQSGTPNYTPPDADLTSWSPDIDLYAAGAVLLEMLTGKVPCDHDQSRLNLRNLCPDIPTPLGQFLEKACAPNRADRFPTAASMLAALAEVRVRLEEPAPARASTTSPKGNVPGLPPYEEWHPRPLPRAAGATKQDVIDGLVEIVASEGPIRCSRLYDLYVKASSDPGVASVKRYLNGATYSAIRQGLLWQVEPAGGGQMDKTVYLPNTPPVVVRSRGPREISDIPPSEIVEHARQVRSIIESVDGEAKAADVVTMLEFFYHVNDPEPWDSDYLWDCLDDSGEAAAP